ncbi:MAG: acyltransferase [Sphingomonas fennica]
MAELNRPGSADSRSNILFGIQVLRGIAASLVVARHCAVHAGGHGGGEPFALGQFGVDIFFVISGVVIYLAGREQAWHVFLRRRMARIVPLYWIVTTLAVAASWRMAADPYWLSNAAASYLFIPAHDSPRTIWPPVMTGWTLNYEVFFYAVCTMVLAAGARRFGLTVAAIIALGVAVAAPFLASAGATIRPAALILLAPISLEFLGGLALGHWWRTGRDLPNWQIAALLAGSLAWLSAFPDSHPYRLDRVLLWGVPAIGIVWAVMALEGRVRFAAARPLLLLGDASYAIYIVHPAALTIFFAITDRLRLPLPPLLLAIVAFCGSVAIGIAVHVLVEKRLTAVASRLLGLRRPAAAAALNASEVR